MILRCCLHFFHRYLPNARIVRPEDLIPAGGAAGIAAAFNTPLAERVGPDVSNDEATHHPVKVDRQL
jgi:hypothetical protein